MIYVQLVEKGIPGARLHLAKHKGGPQFEISISWSLKWLA